MHGFGAIVKAIMRAIEDAAGSADRGLRSVLGRPRPKPCPITIRSETGRRRR